MNRPAGGGAAVLEVSLPSYLHRKTVRGSVVFDSLYLKEVSIYRNRFRVSGVFLHWEEEPTN